MSQEILKYVTAKTTDKRVPVLKPGYTVKVFQKIKEGAKERTQIFEGLVIKLSSGTGVNRTFTVRKVVDGIGVEKVFPIYSPVIEKIELMKIGKVRRAKLYYMRALTGKSTRLREKTMEAMEMDGEEVVEVEEPEEEAVVEEVSEVAEEEVTEEETPVQESEEVEEEVVEAEEVAVEEAEEEKKEA